MANTKDLSLEPHPSILVVGDSGTHKTHFVAGVPDIFVYDFDKGMAVARGRDVEFQTFKDAPKGSKVYNPDIGIYPWGKAWPQFIKHLNDLGAEVESPESPYRAIGLDSLTTLSNICMNYVLKSDGHLGDSPHIQHWGAQIQLMEMVMDQLSAWPVTIVMTAHVQRNTNQVTEVIEHLPLLTGKLAGKVGIYFDEVWYTQVKGRGDKKQFTLQTESYGLYKQAKTRHGVPDGTETEWEAVKQYFRAA